MGKYQEYAWYPFIYKCIKPQETSWYKIKVNNHNDGGVCSEQGCCAAVCVQVNLKAGHVEYNRFYIPDITTLVDIQEDYLKWFLSKAEIVSTGALYVSLSLHLAVSLSLSLFLWRCRPVEFGVCVCPMI